MRHLRFLPLRGLSLVLRNIKPSLAFLRLHNSAAFAAMTPRAATASAADVSEESTLREAADAGSADAAFKLGSLYVRHERSELADDNMDDDLWAQAPSENTSAARAILVDIKAMRRRALVARSRRAQGLPPLSSDAPVAVATAGTDETAAAGRALLRRAADAGHGAAATLLGNLSLAAGAEADALRWWAAAARVPHHSQPTRAAAGGNPDALFNLGAAYYTGVAEAAPRDRARAAAYFSAAAAAGDAAAQACLGVMLHEGDTGVACDGARALALLEAAAAAGHGGAALYLSRLLAGRAPPGAAAPPHDAKRAAALLASAAAAGEADALAEAADAIFHGEGGGNPSPAVASRALALYEAAARGGHAEAAVCAGAMLVRGLGAPADSRRAMALYLLAGRRGCAAGWENAAALHATGAPGVPQNLAAARHIHRVVLPALAREAAELAADEEAEAAAVAAEPPPVLVDSSSSEALRADGAAAAVAGSTIETSLLRAEDPDPQHAHLRADGGGASLARAIDLGVVGRTR